MTISGQRSAGANSRTFVLRRSSGPLLVVRLLLGAAAVGVIPALAAEGGSRSASQALFIAQLALLLLVGRLLGELAQRVGQPSVMGQLIGGLLLGPSLFGLLWPSAQHAIFPTDPVQKSMLDAVSELGVLMLLLLTGMETDLQMVRRVGRAAIAAALAGVAIPFACGFALGEFLPAEFLPRPDARLVTSIFLGTALSISSVKIVAIVIREMNFMRRDLGQIIVASAILEDTIGWVIIAVAFGLAAAGTIDVWSVSRAVLGTGLFMVASLTVGRRIVFRLIRWANDNFKSDFPVITTILIIMAAMALTTQLIGVNTVLGAFVAGILIGESPILTRHIDEELCGLIVAFAQPRLGAARRRADRDREHREISRRVHRRHDRRVVPRRIAGVGMRHECARLDRGDRRDARSLDRPAQPKPVHPDRHHGDRNDDGNAEHAALGAQAPAVAQERTPAAQTRRAGCKRIRNQSRKTASCRRRQRQWQIRRAACRDRRRFCGQTHDHP